jgi:hypothetical protein
MNCCYNGIMPFSLFVFLYNNIYYIDTRIIIHMQSMTHTVAMGNLLSTDTSTLYLDANIGFDASRPITVFMVVTTRLGNAVTFRELGASAILSNFSVPAKVLGNAPFLLTAPTTNSTGAFTYSSSNPAVATVSGTTVTLVGAGSTTITATQAATATYASNSISASLVVTVPTIPTTQILSTNNMNAVTNALQITGRQYQTNLIIGHAGNLAGWDEAGSSTVCIVDTANVYGGTNTPNYAIMLWVDNVITQTTAVLNSNVVNTQYIVNFKAGPAVYEDGGQATAATASDGIVFEILRANNTVLATNTYLPGAWAGFPTLTASLFTYTGDGSGDVRVRIRTVSTSTGRFGGCVDDVVISSNDAITIFNVVGTTSWTVPAGVTSVSALIVGGGGGGGRDNGGGGGGGGVIVNTNIAVTPGASMSIVVGSGGAAAVSTSTVGSNGGNSSFAGLIAIGGGGGGSIANITGADGGSAGGRGGLNAGTRTGTATTTPLQGNNGGGSNSGVGGGGGGGAGQVGANGGSNVGGNGGDGIPNSISGSIIYYAGGGGGGGNGDGAGAGGNGGGGAGVALGTQTPTVGTNGLGGGGGGGGGSNAAGPGARGGSGIVIISYV